MTHLPTKTPKTFAHKLASLQSSAWLPAALLLLALSSAFIFGAEHRDYFYRGLTHNATSAKSIKIADDLSIDHYFLMFEDRTLGADGKITYIPYNRFPIGSYALTKLAILPFGDDLSAKISAARMLMLLFFAAAAVLAYLSLRRLTHSRWIALTAALLAFSSPHFLYFNDVITSEAVVDIFGALLVFHGMVVFEQERRFRQLLLKTCIALVLGWHVYALMLPFIAFGLMREFVKTRLRDSTPPFALRQLKHTALSLTRSRYLTLGVVALLFGVFVLTVNFTNEYFAMNREIPPTELPSFRSMMYRTGVGREARDPNYIFYTYQLHSPTFWGRQFHRIGGIALPYAFSPSFEDRDRNLSLLLIVYGMTAFGASLIGLLFIQRHKILLASLALSGFCWTLPMRHQVAQPGQTYEALLYVGVALTLFSLLLPLCRRIAGERLLAALSVIAALVFVASALRMSQINNPEQTDELHRSTSVDFEDLRRLTDKRTIGQRNNPKQTAIFHKAAIADFEIIRAMTDDGNLIQTAAIPRLIEWILTINYYLSGRIDIPGHETAPSARPPNFVVSGLRLDGLAPLTPQNQMAFLYEWDAYHNHINEIMQEQIDEPLTRYGFDVHLVGNSLIYAKDDCREDDITGKFFLTLYPVHESDLPDAGKPHGFDNLDFRFQDRAVRRGERCIAIAPLPDYDIARIYTGQFIQLTDSTARPWAGRLIDGKLMRIDEITEQSGEPLIRSDFDVYINDKLLIYSKDDCSQDDISQRFFLALFPTNQSDLPDARKAHGFNNLDFRFQDRAIRRDDRCVAVAPLPNYDITRIHTGQYTQQADGSFEHLWEGEIHLTEAAR